MVILRTFTQTFTQKHLLTHFFYTTAMFSELNMQNMSMEIGQKLLKRWKLR